MARKAAVLIVGAVIVGVTVGGLLLLLYPDLMFRNTGLNSQGGATTRPCHWGP